MTYYAPAHLLAAPQGFVGRVRHWIEMRRTLDSISSLDDHMLADIGWHRATPPRPLPRFI